MDAKDLKKNAIYVTRHGSHAYGLNIASSDLDIKGVLIGKPQHYLGYLHRVAQIEEKDPNDLVIYELQKFFKLAADCNPNIIEVLWSDDSDVLFCNEFGDAILDLREKFLSQKAKFTFSGYAMAQLKRIKGHYRWIRNPPNPSNPEDWAKYIEWKKVRNPTRAELEEKFGYDTKHAMHLVRLLRMGEEILTTGKVNVRRADREELLAIREGQWKYDDLIEWAEKQDAKLNAIYEAKSSPLPREPDRQSLDESCMGLVSLYLGEGPDKRWDGKVW